MAVPNDFLWGVASSSYQIEGAVRVGGRSDSVWDVFCRTPGKVYQGHTGDTACDHIARMDEDVALIADLGVGAYRLSVSWPRVLPGGTGAPSEEGLGFYDRLVDALLERGVQPWVTLYHWDHPQSIQDKGGWQSPESPAWFAEYTGVVVDRLSDRVQHWMTLNEPQIFIGLGHVLGVHAPGLKLSRKESLLASHHALLAHGRAVDVIRERAKTPPTIGWAPVMDTIVPDTDSEQDRAAAKEMMLTIRPSDGNWAYNNTWFGDAAILGHYPEDGLRLFGDDSPKFTDEEMSQISRPIDFYGVNVYTGSRARMGADGPEIVPDPPGRAATVFDWTVQPEVLDFGPRIISERYKLPIYITENGLASMDWVSQDGKVHDHGRVDFLARYIGAMERAVGDGVDIRGYFQWSVFDNFEWAEGYKMRFGLVHVDYQTLERTPKASYHWYRDHIASR